MIYCALPLGTAETHMQAVLLKDKTDQKVTSIVDTRQRSCMYQSISGTAEPSAVIQSPASGTREKRIVQSPTMAVIVG
jgi:hypothetical protein